MSGTASPGRRAAVMTMLTVCVALGCAPSATGAGDGPVTIAANGDPLTGSLSFRQDLVEMAVGETVRFVNGSDIAAHTATERNGLWDLSLAPRASATRTMEAGTHLIVCRIHPDLMRATIRVAPTTTVTRTVVRRRTRSGVLRKRTIRRTARVRWALAAPAAGESFDVQRRSQDGAWALWQSQARTTDGSFAMAAGGGWEVRARLRQGDVVGAWSPAAPVTP